jgi:hypothetical protein
MFLSRADREEPLGTYTGQIQFGEPSRLVAEKKRRWTRPTGCWAESTKQISSARPDGVPRQRFYRHERH